MLFAAVDACRVFSPDNRVHFLTAEHKAEEGQEAAVFNLIVLKEGVAIRLQGRVFTNVSKGKEQEQKEQERRIRCPIERDDRMRARPLVKSPAGSALPGNRSWRPPR